MAFRDVFANLKVFLTIAALAGAGFGNSYAPRGVLAADPDPVQDFCIPDLTAGGPTVDGIPCEAPNPATADGFSSSGFASAGNLTGNLTGNAHRSPCQDPKLATADDFSFSGLAKAGNLTGNALNGTATFGFVREWPALNTLGLGLVRLDINPGGVILPHTHNLASEILFCLEGEIYTGFVTNSDNPAVPNKLYAKIVKKGEAFIFPRGLLHFQLNKGTVPAVSLNVLNGQNPGIQLMPVALFGVGIDPEVLAKSFFINEAQVARLEGIMSRLVHVFD